PSSGSAMERLTCAMVESTASLTKARCAGAGRRLAGTRDWAAAEPARAAEEARKVRRESMTSLLVTSFQPGIGMAAGHRPYVEFRKFRLGQARFVTRAGPATLLQSTFAPRTSQSLQGLP